MNAPEIKISHVPYLLDRSGKRSTTPARCNRVTGEIFINDQYWPKIKPEHRLFILLHEWGHIHHQTSDEYLADQFAYNRFVELGYPLTQSVQALSALLPGKPQHVTRVKKQYERALLTDLNNNKNMSYFASQRPWYAANNDNYDNYEDLFGMVKNWKKNQEIRRKKKEAKVEIKLAKADSIRAKGEAKKILSEQGIGGGQGFSKILETAATILTPAAAQPQVIDLGPQIPQSEGRGNKVLIWVGVGLAVLTVGVIVIMKIRKK